MTILNQFRVVCKSFIYNNIQEVVGFMSHIVLPFREWWLFIFLFFVCILLVIVIFFSIMFAGGSLLAQEGQESGSTESSFVGESEEMIELGKNLRLRADYMRVDINSGNISASGNVELEGRGMILRSRYLEYNEGSKKLRAYGHVYISLGSYGEFISDDVSFDVVDNRIMTGLVNGLIGENHKFSAASTEVLVDGKDISVLRATYTVCPVCTEEERKSGEQGLFPKPVWQLRVGQIVENDNDTLLLKNISLELFGLSLPFLFFPEFAVLNPNVRRRDGLLFFRGGVGRMGVFVGLPYFISSGSETNLFFVPYLGSSYSMLGGRLENVAENSNLEAEVLYRPEIGDSRYIGDDEIVRYGVKSKYEYRIDENWRFSGMVDTVSDPLFDDLYFYNRIVSAQAPQEYVSELEFFDEGKYGRLKLGNVTNLYGMVPLSNYFIESMWRQEIQSDGGSSWSLRADHLDFREIYTPKDQEGPYSSDYGEFNGERKTSGFAANHLGVERRKTLVFDNGIRLNSSISFDGFSRQREGDIYTGVSRLLSGRYEEGRFEEGDKEDRLWLEARQKVILSWPLWGDVFGERVTVGPFIGVVNTGVFGSDPDNFCVYPSSSLCRSVGEGEDGLRFIRLETMPFTNRIMSESSRTPDIDGMDKGVRVLLGGDFNYIRLGYGDIRLYGGTSFQLSDKTDLTELPGHLFDGDMLYGGAQLLWGEDKSIIYDLVYDISRGEEVLSSLGLRLNFQDRIYFESNYVKLRSDVRYYDEDLNLVEFGVRNEVSDKVSAFLGVTRDLSKDYYRYTGEVIYEIPCFNLKFGLYGESKRDRFISDTKEDSGILFSLDFISIDRDSNSRIIFGRE